ncbi:MAG TPA: peptide ABC transporter substrate-binding protein [Tepidisphaeraceae bacterium]|jgi:oligopeptide transport system substrate-binding protein|nr:peptide ABC transporter substrate-binding protein [Tepidisphaeraceae bacterium]
MLRLLVIPVALLALLGGMMFWSGGATRQKADFSFINRGEIGTLDPNRMSWMQDIRLGYALWEGLYALDPATLDAVPGCAEVEVSPDKTVYTFHIRPAAKWSNGEDVLARDFYFAWRRMLEEPGDYTYLLHYIKGAEDYEKAFPDYVKTRTAAYETWEEEKRSLKPNEKAPPEPSVQPPSGVSGMTLFPQDPRMLQVTLKHPVAFFPDIVAFPPMFPLNEKSMEEFLDKNAYQHTGRRIYDKEFTRPPKLVTNGAYRLESWEFKRRLRLEANPFYWDRAHVRSKVIDQVACDDLQWGYEMYQSGGVDWISEIPGDIGAELRLKGEQARAENPSRRAKGLPPLDERRDLHVFTSFGTYFYSFNCQPKLNSGAINPFADVRVRRALTMVVDKKEIVDTITRLGEEPATTYIPVGAFPRYHSPEGIPRDVEKARQLLAEAGYPGGRGFPSVSLLFNNEGQHGPIAENVHRQWQEKLGIDIRLEGIEIKQFRDRLHSKDYAVCRASWYGDYNDPSTFTDKYLPDGGNNDSAWNNQQYADLCAKADLEPNSDKRLRYFEQAEKVLLDEAPILPIYSYVNSYMFRDNVTGLPLNPRAMVMFKSIEVKR